MTKTILLATALVVHAAFAGNAWYVDSENGNDDWDGKANFASADPASKVGPKKTLGVFTDLVSNGDTIYVAPGYYTNGVSAKSANCRFYTEAGGISLVSTGSAADTFILGEVDGSVSQDASPFGCGPNAILPVLMKGDGNLIKGITIANGRRTTYGGSMYGGGVRFENSGGGNMMVDCVVSNCVAVRGGGVYGLGYALRCRFTGNHGDEGAHAVYLFKAVNCIFENTDGYAAYNYGTGGTVVNCLFRDNRAGGFRSTEDPVNVYNSVYVLGEGKVNDMRNRGTVFHNCFLDFNPINGKEINPVMEADSRIFPAGSLKFTAEGLPMRGNPVIGAAKTLCYDANFPAELEAYGKDLDLDGNARINNTMEIGAIEHDEARIYENDWYVDADNGDDSQTGKTPELAKKTLAAIMEGRVTGDVVHAAPGVYSNDVVTVDEQMFRVKIPKGVSLVGTEGAENSVILGEASLTPDSNYGTGPGAVSCVYMAETDANFPVVSLAGFTLSSGCSASATGDGSRGAAVKGSSRTAGIIADCTITNCATARGPVFKVGGVVRCSFVENISVEGAGGAVFNVNCVCDSYFRNNRTGYLDRNWTMHDVYNNDTVGPASGFVMNCTFDSDGNGGPHSAGATIVYAYNCIVKTTSDESGVKYYNSVVTFGSSNSELVEWSVITNKESVALTVESHRPVVGFNPAVNAGNYVYYTNLLPTAVAAVAGKDLWGNPRCVNGVLDVGAVACDKAAVRVSDSSTGLVVEGLANDGLWHDAEDGMEFALSRNFTSPKLLRGVYIGGEYVNFNAHDDDWAYSGVLPADRTIEIVSDYPAVNDWYVDSQNGSDDNDGLRPSVAHAFKTLARASTNALMEAGAKVYVAEGVYNSGVVPASLGVDDTDSRMLVPDGVHFIATGRRSETIVEGASSVDTACGIGSGAVRCCLLKGGSVRGFTMRNGNVNASSAYVEYDQGGGILFTDGNAFAYDCEIYDCNAVRGGGAAGSQLHGGNSVENARLVRCYLHDNTTNVSGVEPVRNYAGTGSYYCSGYNTVVEGDCYRGVKWLNCTITGRCWGKGTTFYNCFVAEDGASSINTAATFTNCVSSSSFRDSSVFDGCVENKSVDFRDKSTWRTKAFMSPLFNAGDSSLYASHFPADLTEFAGLDYAGGERILEGSIDIGAGEIIYDPTGMRVIIR